MKHSTLACILGLSICGVLVVAEISNNHGQNKPLHTDKDLKDAKERWIQNDDEVWDDDMMQHPIDEGPRRVSLPLCRYSGPLG